MNRKILPSGGKVHDDKRGALSLFGEAPVALNYFPIALKNVKINRALS